MDGWFDYATLATALACGLMAGVWFAFSAFVMDGLSRLPESQGAAAMQSINVTAVTPLFMTVLFGAAAACLVLAGWAGLNWSDPRAPWVLGGAVVYLVGTIVMTGAANVPLNDTLAAVDPNSVAGQREWSSYLDSWTAWNHVRALTSLAAAALLTIGLVQG